MVREDIDEEFSSATEESGTSMCYEDIIKYLMDINDIPGQYSDDMMFKFCLENKLKNSFDERNFLNVHSIDKFLNINGFGLKHLYVQKSSDHEYINEAWKKVDQQLLAQIIVHYDDHYMYVLKIINM